MNMSTTQTSQSLIESMSYVVIAVDNDGIITIWNKAAELTLGFEASEALGQHANMVIPVNMQQAHSNCFSKSLGAVKEFAIRKDGVLPFMHKSGTSIKLKGHLAILRGPDGLPQGSAVIGSVAEN
jgi:PAS domain S-box-containing protein